MAKKSKNTKQVIRERTRLEWVLFILLLIIGYLLLASHYIWWPSHKVYDNLGTAFYAGIKAADAGTEAGSSAATTGSDSSGGTGGGTSSNGSNGSTGSAGSNGSNGSNGTNNQGGGSTSSGSGLLTFAAGVNTGDSKQQVDGRANGLTENCAVVVNTSTVGKQEVCTYTQGDKVVTVTYLNDHVVSASRSGF